MKKWTVLVYFAADVSSRQMRAGALANLNQLNAAGSSDEVGVAAQLDMRGKNTRRYVFPAQPNGSATQELTPMVTLPENVNSGDPKTLEDFLKWGAQKCPAENFAVVLWGHGYGIDDFDPTAKSGTSGPVLPACAVETLAATPSMHVPGEFAEPPAPRARHNSGVKSLIFDSHSGTDMTNGQVAAVMERWKSTLPAGQHVAVIGFDCCEMAMMEVWSQMPGCAQFGVGSQYGIPFTSWPYDLIVRALLGNPELSPKELATQIVSIYVPYYENNNKHPRVCLSACDFSGLTAMEASVKLLADALTAAAADETSRQNIYAAKRTSPIFDADGFLDLGEFCVRLKKYMPDSAVSAACDAVHAALPGFVTLSRYAPQHSISRISRSTGVSVWFPAWIEVPDIQVLEKSESQVYLHNAYSSLNFARSTDWDKFLKTMLAHQPKGESHGRRVRNQPLQ